MTDTDTYTLIRDRRRELRVKIKSLAQEARIIRQEERRCLSAASSMVSYAGPDLSMVDRCAPQLAFERYSYQSLHSHRVGEVRREARYSQLAYACIRGKPFRKTEAKSDITKIDQVKLTELVKRFGSEGQALGAVAWLTVP